VGKSLHPDQRQSGGSQAARQEGDVNLIQVTYECLLLVVEQSSISAASDGS